MRLGGAFTRPGFRRLFGACSISMFGDQVMLLVASIWVKELTGSNAMAGLTFLWMLLPAILAPAYGFWLDRLPRKPLLAWGNAVSALIVLPLLLVRDAGDVWLIWAVAFCYGVSFVVLPAALNGLLKEMVPDDELVTANSALQTVKEGFRLIGPLLGAALFAWVGGGVVALVDAVSFVVAAGLILSLRVREDAPERGSGHWWAEMSAGVRHLAREPYLKHVMVAFAMMLLVIGYLESSIYALLDHFDRPPTFVAVLVTAQGVGAIAGGLTASWWSHRLGDLFVTLLGLVLIAASVGAIAATNSLAVVLAMMVLCGYALPLEFVSSNTLMQRRTPQRLMGRVSAAAETLTGTPQAISLAVGAGLVTVLDYHVIFAVIAVVVALAAGYLAMALRGAVVRQVPALDDAEPSTEAEGSVRSPA